MNEWFRKAFGEHYSEVYAHRDAREADEAVRLILSKTGLAEGSLVLDAPCGAGRHLQAFEKAGMRSVGFDLSTALLEEAVERNVLGGRVVRADLRALPFRAKSCDLVVNLFSSLGYLETDRENLAVLKGLVALLKTGGWFVLDFMHRAYIEKHLMAETERVTDSGIRVQDSRWLDGDPLRVNKRTRLEFPDGRRDEVMESVRLFSPEELRKALGQCGVAIRSELGSYQGEAFTEKSSRIILVGQRQ